MAVLVGRPNKTGGAVKLRGDWGGGGSATRSRKSARFCGFAAKCARQNRHSRQVTTKLYCDVMLLAKLSNQDDESDDGNKKIKIEMVLFIIRRKPWNGAGRVLHNLVSSAVFFWGKSPGDEVAFCRFFTAPAVAETGNAIFALISKIFGLSITIKPWLQFRRKYTHTVSHRKDIHDCWISSAYLSLILIIPFDHWFIIILPELAWSDAKKLVRKSEERAISQFATWQALSLPPTNFCIVYRRDSWQNVHERACAIKG